MSSGRLKLQEKIDLSPFALELQSYISNRASTFTETTYFTPMMKDLEKRITTALNDRSADSFFLIDSPFGSGKTHTLITIYEIFREKTPILAIDGHSINKSLWHHIDPTTDPFLPPRAEFFEKVLGTTKLILIDELVVHLKRARAVKIGSSDLAEVTLSFLHSLIVAVKDKTIALVMTLPGRELSYRDEVDAIIEKLRGITHRSSHIYGTMDFEHLVKIIKKQLFRGIKPPESLGGELDNLCYPFHHTVMTLLLSSLPTQHNFQFIRGALRVLSIFLKSNPPVQRTIWTIGDFEIEGNLFDEIVAKLGHTTLGEKLKEDVNQLPNDLIPIARTIFLYTISEGGIGKKEIVECLKNGRAGTSEVREQVERILLYSFFIHLKQNRLVYLEEQTEVKKIVSEIQLVKEEELKHYARERFKQLLKSKRVKVHVFEVEQLDFLPNIIIPYWNEEDPDLILHKVKQRNNTFLLTSNKQTKLEKALKMEMAAGEIGVHPKLYAGLQDITRREFFRAYNVLRYSRNGKSMKLKLIYFKDTGREIDQIINQLVDNQILIDSLNATFLARVIGEGCSFKELKEKLLRDSSLRAPSSPKILIDALVSGEENGLWELQGKGESTLLRENTRIKLVKYREIVRNAGVKITTVSPENFKTFIGQRVEEYSHNIKGNSIKILVEALKSLNRLRLLEGTVKGGITINLRGDSGSGELVLQDCEIVLIHSALKKMLTTFEQIDPKLVEVEFILELDGRVLTSEFVSALRPMLNQGGELIVSVENHLR